MALDTVADMIDHMQLMWGSDVSTHRSKLLKWLQAAEESLMHVAPWLWREEEIDFSIISGTAQYTFDATTAAILDVFNGSGTKMEKMPKVDFERYFRGATTGTPTHWASEPRDESSQQVQIRLWPVPNANATGSVIREVRPEVLSDSASSYSRIPEGMRYVVVVRALKLMAEHDDKPEKMQLFSQQEAELLQNIASKNAETIGRTV